MRKRAACCARGGSGSNSSPRVHSTRLVFFCKRKVPSSMNTRPFYPFILPILFALLPAWGSIGYLSNDPALLLNGGYLSTVAHLFVLVGFVGLVLRKIWALWMHLVLWILYVSFVYNGAPLRIDDYDAAFALRYLQLYIVMMSYLSLGAVSCGLGLWLCRRHKRQH